MSSVRDNVQGTENHTGDGIVGDGQNFCQMNENDDNDLGEDFNHDYENFDNNDNYDNSDNDDELQEREQLEHGNRYVTIRDVLLHQDSDEEIYNTESRELDFDFF